MTASVTRGRVLFAAAVVLAAAAAWTARHVLAVIGALDGGGHRFTFAYAAMFLLLIWQLGSSYLEKPAVVTDRMQGHLDALHVVGIVPAYNEDPAALRACLESMIFQTRRPDTIYVVDDGSKLTEGYQPIKRWFLDVAPVHGIIAAWHIQPNAGKRHAQAAAVRSTPAADVYWTVDSDTISDPNALRELLKPFADPAVQSVAGVVMAANVRSSFLTRFTDLWLVTGQLTDRSSLSVFGCVWVNSGPIAAYRAEVVRDNLGAYLTETFFGRRVPFSDDSLLTLFAMVRGRTVQQPSAFAFSLMPENAGHFCRMFLRWMRGSFIRTWWRVRYLSLLSIAWWLHLLRWAATVVATVLFVAVAILSPIIDPDPRAIPWLVAVPLIVGYGQALRYMTVRRSDQSTAYQWGTWLLTPVAVVFALVVLRAIRWYGIATCWRTGWGTRTKVEVALSS
ncbi:glycosyltransferase [Micromonospora chokoriensis]|uniref:Hyaluronan synthase n=1 Tax=Micromonospora chokoriensis TaxID=356851 RepID=A0A1C4YGM9_9ACTN|nr:glycosyltransferase [Micromonospora chokoriensis]SCF19885.1 hyaluronan synthase [Micromonospora chokoriensis]